MNVLTYGEIMDGGSSVFHSVAKLDQQHLIVTLQGVVRVDNPYRYLHTYIEQLAKLLPCQPISRVTFDFTKMRFCNDNGFYVIMDIIDGVYNLTSCPVVVRRIADDDWQVEALPILLNLAEEHVAIRTTFEDVTMS